MEGDRWLQVKNLFLAASELAENQRANFLDEACGDDPDLRRELESLLLYSDAFDDPVQAPVLQVASDLMTHHRNASLLTPFHAEDAIGKTVSHYRVLSKLGSGGMGVVYKAQDIRLGRFVALKFLSTQRPGENGGGISADAGTFSSDDVERFRREARACSALDHPNICTVYEVDEHESSPFIAMQFLSGHTLKEEIAGQRLAADRVLELGIQIADALDAAHAAGIIHRDIKPGNVFITQRGEAKILDFGLAKLALGPAEELAVESTALAMVASEHTITGFGLAVGTVAYMSPEQVRGGAIETRSDIFSLGVVLYEMVTGVRPFQGENVAAIFDSVLVKSPEPPTKMNDEVSTDLERVILKCLEKDPRARYRSAAELRDQLKLLKLVSDSSLLAAQGTGARRWRKPRIAAGMLLLLGAGVGVYWLAHRPAQPLEHETIVLADVINSTGDRVFDHALKQALRVQLEQSPYMDILPEVRVEQQLGFMGRPVTSALTAEVAREVCLRAGSKAVLQGSIASLGEHYVIGLEAINCQNGDSVDAEQTESASRETVLRAVDDAAIKMRGRLGESLASLQRYAKPVSEATTPSLEALQAYSLGSRTWITDGEEASIPFFKRAIELDPRFAMAYVQLGEAYLGLSQYANAAAALKTAQALRSNTASERERFYIDTSYYLAVTGELDKVIKVSQQWEHTYPTDMAPHTNLDIVYSTLGQHERSLQEKEVELRLRSDSSLAYVNLALAYLCLNQFDKARQVLQQVKGHKLPDSVNDLLYELAFVQGEDKEMGRLLKTAMTQPGSEDMLLSLQADTEAYYGRLASAREYSKRASASAVSDNDTELAAGYAITEALHEAEYGFSGRARQQARAALAHNPGQMVQLLAALALALAGERKRPEEIMAALNRQFPSDTMMNCYWLPTIRAAVELESGSPAKAVEMLQATSTYELGIPHTPTNAVLYPIYLRGTALLRLGQGKQAAAEFQKIVDHRGIVLNFPLGALARLGLARSYALEADVYANSAQVASTVHPPADLPDHLRKAQAAYEAFFSLWKDADGDLPILRQARREYQGLGKRVTQLGLITRSAEARAQECSTHTCAAPAVRS